MEDMYIALLGMNANGELTVINRSNTNVTSVKPKNPPSSQYSGDYCSYQHEQEYNEDGSEVTKIYSEGTYEVEREKKYYIRTRTWSRTKYVYSDWEEVSESVYNNTRDQSGGWGGWQNKKTEDGDFEYTGFGIGVTDVDGNLLAVLAINEIFGFGSLSQSNGSAKEYPSTSLTYPNNYGDLQTLDNGMLSLNGSTIWTDTGTYYTDTGTYYNDNNRRVRGEAYQHIHFHGGDPYILLVPETNTIYAIFIGFAVILINKRKIV